MESKVKSIFTMNTIEAGSFSRSELYGETADGQRAPLLQLNGGGYKTMLVVNETGFTIRNSAGEVLRRGVETDVFRIVDSMRFNAKPMFVDDKLKGAKLSYEDYFKSYAYGQVERTERRKFKVYVERGTGQGEAFGIVEQVGYETVAIHSIYHDGPSSNRERSDFIADFIADLLRACDIAYVVAVNVSDDKLSSKHRGIIHIKGSGYAAKFEQSRLLFDDAKARRTSISEVLAEPVRYKLQNLYEETI